MKESLNNLLNLYLISRTTKHFSFCYKLTNALNEMQLKSIFHSL